jgi:hypothetical protein
MVGVVAIGLLSLSFFPNNSRKKFMSVSPFLVACNAGN